MKKNTGKGFVLVHLCVDKLSVTVTKYLKEVSLKEKRFIQAHSFKGFSPWSLGLTVLRPMVRQPSHHDKNAWQRKSVRLMVSEKQNDIRKVLCPNIPLQDMLPITYFLQIGPIS
jgi:hypothetical protein